MLQSILLHRPGDLNQTLSVPAATGILKYHLLSYVTHMKPRLRVSAGKLQHEFHHVKLIFSSLSEAVRK